MTTPRPTGHGAVDVRVEGAVGWLTLDNPRRYNALSVEMLEALPRALRELDERAAVRVAVITGAGDSFVSGADISQFGDRRTDAQARAAYDRVNDQVWRSFEDFPKPLVAMIRGYCMGAGVVVAAYADIRISDTTARFAIPAAKLGLGYPYRGVQLLESLVGRGPAADLLYTARTVDASEAARIGLVTRLTEPEDLESIVREVVDRIAGNAPLTVAACKAALHELRRDTGVRDLQRVAHLVERCYRSADYVEGQAAFAERRAPVFRGV